MHRALTQFGQNIARVRALGGLHQALVSLTTPAVDASDILRAQVVMAVSALDHYVHELTLLGMLEVYCGQRPTTQSYQRFEVPITTALAGVGIGGSAWFESVIREKHGYRCFQQPDNVANAIRLFSSCDLWPSVANEMNLNVQSVKSQLRLVVDRRNKIAHEADVDPSFPGARWPITVNDASHVTDFVDLLCHAIHVVVV